MDMRAEWHRILDQWAGEAVLMDVGASGAAPEPWLPLASRSWYIAFDPDQREMAHAAAEGGPFKRKTTVHEAITADPGATSVRFHLTRSPFCSSTLVPDRALVSNYFRAERFDIIEQAEAPATTIDRVLAQLGATQLDWLKLDTQGTDRRIYDSISDAVKRTILAVDLEPGLRGAYVGEDLFGDVHAVMRRDGFWLSRADVKGLVRMRQSSLNDLQAEHPDMDERFVQRGVRAAPGWTELRYLRSIESLAAAGAGRREFALLWAIATIDGQHGFALDVAGHWVTQFGADETSRDMREASIASIRAACAAADRASAPSLWKRLRWRVRRLIPRQPGHGPKAAPAGAVNQRPPTPAVPG